MNEQFASMDRDTLAFLVLGFKLMADAERDEEMRRRMESFEDRGHNIGNRMIPIYISVANLIRSVGRVEQEELDRILYGTLP